MNLNEETLEKYSSSKNQSQAQNSQLFWNRKTVQVTESLEIKNKRSNSPQDSSRSIYKSNKSSHHNLRKRKIHNCKKIDSKNQVSNSMQMTTNDLNRQQRWMPLSPKCLIKFKKNLKKNEAIVYRQTNCLRDTKKECREQKK